MRVSSKYDEESGYGLNLDLQTISYQGLGRTGG